MTTREMEAYVAQLYPDPKWQKRVRMMPIEQIVAIYYSSIERKRKQAEEERLRRFNDKHFHQMTINEYYGTTIQQTYLDEGETV